MQLKKSFAIAMILSIIGIASWEAYWRSQDYYPTLNDEVALWAVHRAKVEDSTNKDLIILGSSRAYFDIQLNEWEKETGVKPIQLASTGSSPLPTFHDIVQNTDYNGTILIGVTPGLFFSTTYPGASPWSRPQSKVNHFHDRTYAQRLNFQLSIPLQNNLVFMSADEEEWDDDIDLKSLIRRIQIGSRIDKPKKPPFYSFGDVNIERNMAMRERTVTDTAYASSITKVWQYFGAGAPHPIKKQQSVFLKDLQLFKKKGGKVVLVRFPSSGGVRMGENHALPRKEFWDDLVRQSQIKAYHFEDYEQFKNLKCPEWSHLSAKDARFFTTELAKIMINDGVISNLKNN